MTWFQAFLLGVVEGITEFLPISSTGHMVLVSHFAGIAEDAFTKNFEVIIQLGAILTVLVLYWKRFLPDWNFYQKVFFAFLPTAMIGFLIKKQVDVWLESPTLVAWSLILGGFVLTVIERWKPGQEGRRIADLSVADCVKIGLIQSLAMVPGVSRSAATICGGLGLNMKKSEAAEFSFFLAVPTMMAATAYKIYQMLRGGVEFTSEQWGLLAVGFFVSFVVAGLAIKTLMGFIQKRTFMAFGLYRIVLGSVILILLS